MKPTRKSRPFGLDDKPALPANYVETIATELAKTLIQQAEAYAEAEMSDDLGMVLDTKLGKFVALCTAKKVRVYHNGTLILEKWHYVEFKKPVSWQALEKLMLAQFSGGKVPAGMNFGQRHKSPGRPVFAGV